MVYGYGYVLGPSPVPPIYLTGSFGPVLLPGWVDYTRRDAGSSESKVLNTKKRWGPIPSLSRHGHLYELI